MIEPQDGNLFVFSRKAVLTVSNYNDGIFRPTKEELEQARERLNELRAEYEKNLMPHKEVFNVDYLPP